MRASLPGIGGRYLAQVARSAARRRMRPPRSWPRSWSSWSAGARTCCWHRPWRTVVASGPRRPGVHGPRAGRGLGRWWVVRCTHALTWQRRPGRWPARGYLCAAAVSGSAPPRAVAAASGRRLTASGVPVGRITHGVAAALGASWAVELLGAPPLSAAQLQGLREQFGAAPRCDWCGLPVVGRHCRRCSPGRHVDEPAPPPQHGVRGVGARAGAGRRCTGSWAAPVAPRTPADAAGRVDAPPGGARAADRRQRTWPSGAVPSRLGRTRTSWPTPASRWVSSQPWRCRPVLR